MWKEGGQEQKGRSTVLWWWVSQLSVLNTALFCGRCNEINCLHKETWIVCISFNMDYPNNKNRRATACASGPEWMGHFSAILVIQNGWNGPWMCPYDLTTQNLNWSFLFSFYFSKQSPSSSQEVLLLHCVLITISVLLRTLQWLHCMESL